MTDDRIQRLERTVDELAQRVQALENQIVDALQGRPSPLAGGIPDTRSAEPADASSTEIETGGGSALSYVGRTLLVLGGGFLIRAATESGALPEATGAFLGFLYGLGFLLLAYRAARGTAGILSARFHGLGSSLIVFPLIWEATVQKGYLSVPGGTASLAVAVALALGVAWRRRLRMLAWLFSSVGAAMAFALAWSTHWWLPLMFLCLAICWTTLLLLYIKGWGGMATVGGIFADAIVLLLGSLYLLRPDSPYLDGLGLGGLLFCALLLIVAYLGSFVFRTLVRQLEIHPLEILQSVAVLVIGVGLVVLLGQRHPMLLKLLGWISLVAAGASYAVSFVFIDRQKARRRNFIYYTSIALALMMVMAATLTAGNLRTWLLLLAAALTAGIGVRRQRVTLLLHATLFATAASLSSGLLGLAFDAFTGSVAVLDFVGTIPVLAVLLLLGTCSWVQIQAHQDTWGPLVRAPKILCLALLVVGGSGVLAAALESLIAGGQGTDGAWAASIRTGVLAVFGVLTAALASRPRFREALWMVYPVLVLAGFELVFGDFRHGRPVTMFVSLALYGGALILAPRLLKRARSAAQTPPGPAMVSGGSPG